MKIRIALLLAAVLAANAGVAGCMTDDYDHGGWHHHHDDGGDHDHGDQDHGHDHDGGDGQYH